MNLRTLAICRGRGPRNGRFCAGAGARARKFRRPDGSGGRRGCASANQLDCRSKLYDSHDYYDAISNSTGEKSVDQ